MKQIKLSILFFLLCVGLNAQSLSFDFGYYPDAEISVTLKQGISEDTLFTGTLNEKGKTTITVPERFTDYKGMARVLVGKTGLDFILNNENISIRCLEEYFGENNLTFENSPENNFLQKYMKEQAVRLQKAGLVMEAELFYQETDAFYSSLKREKEKLQAEQSDFELMLRKNPLYAASFIQYYNFLNNDVQTLPYADSAKKENVRKYIREELDVEGLFASGLWFETINGLLTLYEEGTPHHVDFINDMSLLLARASYKNTYTAFAENLFTICETMGWSDLEEELAYFLINDGKTGENPTGKLKMLLTLFKLSKGSEAPALKEHGDMTKTLLVFYDSGCNSCENEMLQLKSNYSLIKEKGYEVVSVSADENEQVFKNASSDFPWQDNYCDLEGFSGNDFRNYGIVGTPTFFLIDEYGRVQGRYAKIQDLIFNI